MLSAILCIVSYIHLKDSGTSSIGWYGLLWTDGASSVSLNAGVTRGENNLLTILSPK